MIPYQHVCDEIGPRRPNAHVRNHLLLGNGFSIACDPIFKYEKLFEHAKMSGLSQEAIGLSITWEPTISRESSSSLRTATG
jgi:hypothetical protein